MLARTEALRVVKRDKPSSPLPCVVVFCLGDRYREGVIIRDGWGGRGVDHVGLEWGGQYCGAGFNMIRTCSARQWDASF
jgi:hypothetical protein